jgi:hypothetical protein
MQDETPGTGRVTKVDRIHKPSLPPAQVRLVKPVKRRRFDRFAAFLASLVLVLTVLLATGVYTQIFGVVFPTGSIPSTTIAPTRLPSSAMSPTPTSVLTPAPTPLPTLAPTATTPPTPTPTLAPAPKPTATPGATGTYTVKAQDTLFRICKAQYGKYTEAYKQLIIQANTARYPSIAPDGVLRVGWVLTIPPKP